jgi:hypothetical protein
MICKKKTLKVNQKSQHLTKIVTKTAENTLKQAASIRNDIEMLIEVWETDLIEKNSRNTRNTIVSVQDCTKINAGRKL